MYGEKTGVLLHCKIVDISHPRDVKRHEQTKRVTELSFEVTQRVCGTTKGSVRECPVTIIDLR